MNDSNENATPAPTNALIIDRALGIDLGTTNSEVALLDPSEKDLLVYADRFGRKVVPSALSWNEETQDFFVGHEARRRRGTNHPPIESIKRKMGRADRVQIGPHELTPEEVSAKILGTLRALMNDFLQAKVPDDVRVATERAVITVPAYFDAPQVEATRKAGELAGLDVLGVLQEPTAAAIYYAWKYELADGNYLVYDLGGGTFDVSILRCIGGEYQVLAIDGDNFLGGDDFDRRFAEVLRQRLVERGYALELDVAGDPADARRFQRIVHFAQEIKEALSTTNVLPAHKQDFVADKEEQLVTFDAEIGRDEYETTIADLIDTTIVCCERALQQSQETAAVGIGDIDHVILVGGSTRVPAVVAAVRERLCAKAKNADPLQAEVDTCVALGAAVHAAQLGGLRLSRPADDAAITFRSPLVTEAETLALRLEIGRAPEGAEYLAVEDAEGPLLREALTDDDGDVRKLAIPLEAAETTLSLVFQDAGQRALATLPFTAYRGDVRPAPSQLSRPTVLPKDLALEVVKAGRRERKVLIARGTGLPTKAQHRFFTADRSGAVVLRLLQNRLPIKTLVLQVPPEVEVGTPVMLDLSCDEAMRLEAHAEVAGQKLWAQIESAQLETPSAGPAVEALLAEGEQIGAQLWGREASAYRRIYEPLATGLRETLSTDPDKAAALSAKLQLLVDEFRDPSGDGLQPPMHRFEGTLDALRRVVYRAGGGMLGMDLPGWETRIEDLAQRGSAAWDSRDASTWRRTYNELQALLETASEQEFAGKSIDDPAYLQMRLMRTQRWAANLEQALIDFVPSAAPEVMALQRAEQQRLVESFRTNISTPLAEFEANGIEGMSGASVRRKIERMTTELERLESSLERLPQLGLVSERGGEI